MVATTGGADAPSEKEIERLADEFEASPEQIRAAIAAVGPRQADIEMHLRARAAPATATASTTRAAERRSAGVYAGCAPPAATLFDGPTPIRSNARASCSTARSPCGRPINCTPIGNPFSLPKPTGIAMHGSPASVA